MECLSFTREKPVISVSDIIMKIIDDILSDTEMKISRLEDEYYIMNKMLFVDKITKKKLQ